MPFHPQVGDQLTIDSVTYCVAEHPAAPGIPYGQAGRRAIVYALISPPAPSPLPLGGRGEGVAASAAGGGVRARAALKVFNPRFRVPALVLVAQNLAPYAALPGLQVCQRTVLIPEKHKDLLQQHPDLTYAVLMPWIEGSTWMEVMIEKRALTAEESLALARSLAGILADLEGRGLAHCDLSGPNVILPPGEGQVVLVDLEDMYGPRFAQPEVLPGGSPGYAHKTAPQGLWGPEADRFAGAVLIAEMLCWHDERVREAAWGEQYFAPEEMQQDAERYRLLAQVLRERWGKGVAGLFERAWGSDVLEDCVTFGEWMIGLHPRVERGIRMSRAEKEETTMVEKAVQERLAQVTVEKAKALMDIGEIERALTELEEAYRLAPDVASDAYADALLKQGLVKEDTGQPDEALALYRQVLQVAPEGSALRQETAAMVRRLEVREPSAVVHPVVKPTLFQALSAGWRGIAWMLTTFAGWAIILVLAEFSMGPELRSFSLWALIGTLVGTIQWLLLKDKVARAGWWILAAAIGWGACWEGAVAIATRLWLFLTGVVELTYSERFSLYWSITWPTAILLSAIFNGVMAALLLRDHTGKP